MASHKGHKGTHKMPGGKVMKDKDMPPMHVPGMPPAKKVGKKKGK